MPRARIRIGRLALAGAAALALGAGAAGCQTPVGNYFSAISALALGDAEIA